MFFFTLVLGIWFLPKVETLNCYECIPDFSGKCTASKKLCPSDYNQCTATGVFVFSDDKMSDVQAKGCGVAETCGDFSVNFGKGKTVIRSQCCTGELCNNVNVPDYKSTPNGKKCFSCVGQDCTRTLNCEGNEDRCIKATMNMEGNIQTMKGCTSEQVCSDKLSTVLNQFSGLDISCCQGNYCNGAVSTSAGLLLLLVPLISVVWFV